MGRGGDHDGALQNPLLRYRPTSPRLLASRVAAKEALEFGHSLDDLIGGQIAAGFAITGFFEDSSGGDFLDPYIDTFIATRAAKH